MAAVAPQHHPSLPSSGSNVGSDASSGAARHGGHGARGRSPWRMRRTKARRQGAVAAPGLRATHERVAGRTTDRFAHIARAGRHAHAAALRPTSTARAENPQT